MTAIPDPPGGGLGPEARALLDAAREGLSPDSAAVRRVHARIHIATGGAAAGAAAGAALGIKLGLIALVAAGVVVGASVYRRGPTAVAPPALELANPAEQPQRAAVHEAAPPPPTPHPADDALIVLEPMPRAVRRTAPRSELGARPPAASPPAAISPAAGTGIALGREVELIDQAMAALRRGDPGGALHVVHDYAREAGGAGQLAEDAAAIEVEALCTLGDPAARDRRAQFEARFPRSAQQARLAAACR
ncbi:MAG TPA: hypothetical protein VHW23_01205 [Kofleriaceae bacterium]|jgi:hypothetical protein|nr:hypothetical protein [Kofleriaceae bacterium]